MRHLIYTTYAFIFVYWVKLRVRYVGSVKMSKLAPTKSNAKAKVESLN